MEEARSCPCIYLEKPCNERCSCKCSFSSYGCDFCCTYGSKEQRVYKANVIAEKLRKIDLNNE